jgi:hypothetical protein
MIEGREHKLTPFYFQQMSVITSLATALLYLGFYDESLGLLAAVTTIVASIAARFSCLLPVGNAVQATSVPRRELDGTGFLRTTSDCLNGGCRTSDGLNGDGSRCLSDGRCRGLGDWLQNANGAVIRSGGSREGKQAKNSKNRLHINSLNVFAEVFGDKIHYSRIPQKSKMHANNGKIDNLGCSPGGMG